MTDQRREQHTEVVYQFIKAYIHKHGYSPSLREIGEGCYFGRSTILRYLDRLEARGRIQREPGKARSITLPADRIHEGLEEKDQKVGQMDIIYKNICATLEAEKERALPPDT